ncbi:hypothetical protein [Conexibacter sp. SYSU D00693]|uniref:hypothetical protein n=1 Tax=Conexibacter sp. SYSU D00693 TaxID=2812560 RepID=UPI00196AB1CF|nr:hypothetical protein [Conexibacter sp. SYSU D00693]
MLQEAHAQARAQVEEWATAWKWGPVDSTWEMVEPFMDERWGRRARRRRPRGSVPDPTAAVLYAFDAEDRVIASRQFRRPGSVEADRETLRWIDRAHREFRLTYSREPPRDDGGPRLDVARLVTREDDLPVELVVWSQAPDERLPAVTRERYHREARVLRRIEIDRVDAVREGDEPDGPIGVERSALVPTYDAGGTLVRLVLERPDEPPDVLYTPPGPGGKRLRHQVVERLAAGAREFVSDAMKPVPAALILAYDAESASPLPPSLGVAHGEAANDVSALPLPADLPVFDPDPAVFAQDEALLGKLRTLQGQATDEAQEARRLLTLCAEALRAGPPLQDVVAVVVCDLELDDVVVLPLG